MFFPFFFPKKVGRDRSQRSEGVRSSYLDSLQILLRCFDFLEQKNFFGRGEGGPVHFHAVTFFKPQHLLKFQWISYQI